MDIASPPDGYSPCVGVMLLDAAGRIFVGERIDTPGAWQMPQGGIDAGEAPLDAAIRELQEETGITDAALLALSPVWRTYDVPPELARRAWDGNYRGQAQIWAAFRFLGIDADIDLAAHHAEFSRYKWTDPPSLLAEIVDFKRAIYAEVIGEFAGMIGNAG